MANNVSHRFKEYSTLGWRNRKEPSKRLYEREGREVSFPEDHPEDRVDKVGRCIALAADAGASVMSGRLG